MRQHNIFGGIDDMKTEPIKKEMTKEEIVKQINERISYIRTLGRNFGNSEIRIEELEFILNLIK